MEETQAEPLAAVAESAVHQEAVNSNDNPPISPEEPPSAELDCMGIEGGLHQLDPDGTCCLTADLGGCGYCDGADAGVCGCTADGQRDSQSCIDCAGIPYGPGKIDECGVCGGDGSSCKSAGECEYVAVTIKGDFYKNEYGDQASQELAQKSPCLGRLISNCLGADARTQGAYCSSIFAINSVGDSLENAKFFNDPLYFEYEKAKQAYETVVAEVEAYRKHYWSLPEDERKKNIDKYKENDRRETEALHALYRANNSAEQRGGELARDAIKNGIEIVLDLQTCERSIKTDDTKACEVVVIKAARIAGTKNSPISLLWQDGADINGAIAVTRFPLALGSKEPWFTWKASAATPLLVFDPAHRGNIEGPAQLFGNYTFGGALSGPFVRSSQNISRSSELWKDGYEALATLDADGNGKVDGEELSPLGLWFDRDQDGISDSGEVVSLEKSGVDELYYTATKRDPQTSDIYATPGFRRTIDGKAAYGTSVDWFGAPASSKRAALAELSLQSSASNSQAQLPASPLVNLPAVSRTSAAEANMDGAWEWYFDDEDEKSKFGGLLMIRDGGNEVSGSSLTELAIQSTRDKAIYSLLRIAFLSGKKYYDDNGEVAVAWQISGHGAHTTTTAQLSTDRAKLLGTSETKFANPSAANGYTVLRYSWRARRVG